MRHEGRSKNEVQINEHITKISGYHTAVAYQFQNIYLIQTRK